MQKQIMSVRSELLVKEVFLSSFTWRDAEDFFCINRNFLHNELKSFFQKTPNSEERLRRFNEKIEENEKIKEISPVIDQRC